MRRTQLIILGSTLVGGLALSFPHWASPFAISLVIRIFIFGLAVMSVSFLAGQLGLVSLMSTVFFGISGYMVAVLQVRYAVPFPFPPIAGLLSAVILAILMSFVVLRTKGVYFLMLTFVISLAVWALALQLSSITGGTTGIIGIHAPTIAGVSLKSSRTAFYYAGLLVFFVAITLYFWAGRSRFGLALRGIRESGSRMAMLGYPVLLLKAGALVLSSMFAALGGILFVYFYGVLSPDAISLMPNVDALLGSILGGVASLAGAILGATIVKAIDNVLGALTERYLLISGVIFLFTIVFLPEGIMGTLRRRWYRGRIRRSYENIKASIPASEEGDQPNPPANGPTS